MGNKYKYFLLQKYFGYTTFREGQEMLIDALLAGQDVLGVMPTGAGKSICYQIPALMLPGITLVVSPLISLMIDQVMALCQAGIPAAYLNSSLSSAQFYTAITRARRGAYKIIYVAPERLLNDSFVQMCQEMQIALVAVDEAHCVSQWGQDFRPSYCKITSFIDTLSKRPIIGAFTATATQEVREDIHRLLGLQNPVTRVTGFDRKNLYFEVRQPESRKRELLSYLGKRHGDCGIIYCNTRRQVEDIHTFLNEKDFAVARYHAGLDSEERARNQDDFVYDRKNIMVATNAFGMGIDKSNVSYVLHYNMPMCLENYYQEAGRAGRDGSPAECVLFYSGQDVKTNQYLIEHGEPNPELSEKEQEQVRKRDQERLRVMTLYATSNSCLRGFILRYFGDRIVTYCGNCSHCNGKFDVVDITDAARQIVSCVRQMQWHYGIKMVIDIVRGVKNERIEKCRFDRLPCYARLKEYSEKQLRQMVDTLLAQDILNQETQYRTLELSTHAEELLIGKLRVNMHVLAQRSIHKETATQEKNDAFLFQRLKETRLAVARASSLPSYVIFSDATLQEMARKQPRNLEQLTRIKGVSKAQAERYGQTFLEALWDKKSCDPAMFDRLRKKEKK